MGEIATGKIRAIKTEVIVFAAIAAIVIVGTLAVSIPQDGGGANAPGVQASALPNLGKAPDFAAGSWINSQPLTIKDLRSKVVLIDFWTYSCINCIRTLPYLKDWYSKYSADGFVIVGVHTPEFEFEKDYSNVAAAVEQYGIKYPVVQDNDYDTWNAYKNQYWPRHYLIDREGNIRYDHIGEGAYDETENAIRGLLGMNNIENAGLPADLSGIGTPEIYLGYSRAEYIGNPEGLPHGKTVGYNATKADAANTVYLSGTWMNNPEDILSVNNSKLYIIYKAKNVNIVAGGNATVKILLDGIPPQDSLGTDAIIENSAALVRINGSRLYNIVSTPGYEVHQLELDASPGLELYTFTFG